MVRAARALMARIVPALDNRGGGGVRSPRPDSKTFLVPQPRPNIHELARLSGFSVGTVSRALNGYADVRAETRETILRVARSSTTRHRPRRARWSRGART